MGFIWALIVGGVIGAIAGAITKKGSSMGIIANIIAGLVGSTIGQAILGTWGPSLAGMAIVPSIIGAVILVAIVSWILGENRKTWEYLKFTLRMHHILISSYNFEDIGLFLA